MTVNDHASQERYVALQAWLCGQMSPRAPHAADLFEQDRECLYDAFLSVLVGTRLGFADYDDNQAHHGLYAFDFFVGDLEAPSCRAGVDGARGSGVAGESATDVAARAMCHAIVDTWLGDTSARIPFVASVIASVATLELVADVSVDGCVFECELLPGYARSTANYPWEDGSLPIGSLDSSLVIPGPLIYVEAGVRYEGQVMSCLGVDECVFECDLPPEYARCTANMPWEDGSLPIGALDLSLVAPGPLIYVEAGARYARQPLSCSGFDEALASCVQMGLAVESSMASSTGVTAVLRAPHGGPEMLGWAADAVARALSACGYTGVVQIRARFAHAPA